MVFGVGPGPGGEGPGDRGVGAVGVEFEDAQRRRSGVGLGGAAHQRAEGGAEVAAGGGPADRGGGRAGCLLAGDQPGQPERAASYPVEGGGRAEPVGPGVDGGAPGVAGLGGGEDGPAVEDRVLGAVLGVVPSAVVPSAAVPSAVALRAAVVAGDQAVPGERVQPAGDPGALGGGDHGGGQDLGPGVSVPGVGEDAALLEGVQQGAEYGPVEVGAEVEDLSGGDADAVLPGGGRGGIGVGAQPAVGGFGVAVRGADVGEDGAECVDGGVHILLPGFGADVQDEA